MRVVLIVWLSLLSGFVNAASPEAVYGKQGMVASRSTLASEAGIEVMKRGGNAVDGAVATAFALAVTYPSAGNIGGGGFVVVRLPDGSVVTQDHRETAPAAAYRDMYLDEDGNVIKGLSIKSHLATGVPGSVAGLLDLLERYGNLSRKEVMAPAIRLASKGFELNWYLARNINRKRKDMMPYAASIQKFSQEGEAFEPGDIWRQPDLAKTLKLISRKGRDGFYKGKTADLIVAEMARGGGIITHQDLENYTPVWREPVHGTYRGYDIWGMGPPSSGGVLITQILNMLEPYDLGSMGWGSSESIHLMIEAERRAFADRAEHLGDPDYYDVPISVLTDKAYALNRFRDFDPSKASDSNTIYAGEISGDESMETTHLSVMDDSGMMVSLTTTLNSTYGNKIVVPGTGILLNNEMNDFSSKPNVQNQFKVIGREANSIAPGKRMLSSMSPTIVTRDGEPVLVTGSPGGSTIITTTVQVILNVIDHGMTIEDAVSVPRFHHQWKPDYVLYEEFVFTPDVLSNLKNLGHKKFTNFSEFFRSRSRGIGDANSIMVKDGVLQGARDPRTDSKAIGF